MRGMNPLVVVIDDSLLMCKILEICLSREGYEVKSFQDGIEAIRWVISPEARIPGLIFVDLILPKLDGYTVIQRLKGKPGLRHTVFVMISARDGVIDRLKGRLAGASTYLTKPVRTQDIVAVVQQHLGTPAAQRPEHETG